jgi:hypothetical protein
MMIHRENSRRRLARWALLAVPAFAFLMPASARADWHRASSRHFIVYSDDAPEKIKAYTQRLERFDKAIRIFHGMPDDKRGPASRVTLFFFKTVGDIGKLSSSKNISAAGFYNPRVKPVAFMPKTDPRGTIMTPEIILFHEYTHHWMLTSWADAAFPAWFTEGSAEMHATALMRPDGSVTFGAPPLYRPPPYEKANILPARQLLKSDIPKLDESQRVYLYTRGWLLVDYLTFDPARRSQLAAYITAINGGKSVDEASRQLGDPGTLDARMEAFGRNSQRLRLL